MQPSLGPFLHVYSTVGNIGSIAQFPCTDSSYTILVFGRGSTLFLSGAFSFQVLYGCISVNGFLFTSGRFNASNFTTVSIPHGHLPASFSICNELSTEEVHIERIQSRLREFVNDSKVILPFIEEYQPVAILLVKLEMDIVSRFVKQQTQYLLNIFSRVGTQLGPNLFCMNVAESGEGNNVNSSWSVKNVESLQMLEESYRDVLLRIGKVLETESCCVIQTVGNKGVGKSTMCRYLMNSLNSRSTPETCKVFLLDLDPSFSNSYFFGSNNIAVDSDSFLKLAELLIQRFIDYESASESSGEKCVLIVNTPGWIEDLGYDLMLKIINSVKPNILVCIDKIGNGINFEVPKHLQKITMRIRLNCECPQLPPLGNSAILRNFLVIGYLAQTFRRFKPKLPSVGMDLRLSDTLASYRVPFRSISVYTHPEILHIEDHLILNVLNCSFVALCKVEDGSEKCVERRPLLADNSLPSRLLLCRRGTDCAHNGPSPNRNEKLHEGDGIIELNAGSADEMRTLPLRCIGFGLIRAISLERKLFYIITPVEQRKLGQVDVLALGHCLNTPELVFPTNPYTEAVPYLVELSNKNIGERHKKLFSPLRVITGAKRALHARLMQMGATQVTAHLQKRIRHN
ncbi:hypothetical protein niasHS_013498 [Heterodera schachtii]|uniref:Polynucleotide 5'-hydroxyl-kinase NOL9 n=1 Tax=Heterodera schachtii TaxID=97005 RepID=A0ABD2I934_HETSC